MKRLLLTLALAIPFLLSAQDPNGAAQDSILRLLQRPYTPNLNVEWGPDSLRAEMRFRELRYRLEDSQTVSALYFSAKRKNAALIIFQHWGGGNRRSFLPEAETFVKAGYHCLLLDAPWLWPTADKAADPVRVYPDNILRSCRAIISFLDWGERVDSFDKQRIYYVGHSYGATLGGLILAAEPRIRAAVLMAGLPSLSVSMQEDPGGQWKGTKERMPATFDSAVQRLALMEPEALIQRSDARVFYQVAEKDQYVARKYSERYIRAAKPARTGWYQTDHLFADATAQRERFEFIRAQDSVARHGYKAATDLLLAESKRLGTFDWRFWNRQEWRGRVEPARNAAASVRQTWRFQFPDSLYTETASADGGGEVRREQLMLGASGGFRRIKGFDSTTLSLAEWQEERQLFFMTWAAHVSPLLSAQLHVSTNTAGTTVTAVQRPFLPVRLFFVEGKLQYIESRTSGERNFRLTQGNHKPYRLARLPYFYELRLNGNPYRSIRIDEIIVPRPSR
ncbi:MAG: alpha/beta fold hydrolase [Chitinophagaceae bacterium]|nr:MAG: alpha/beta fold hydrolase [Chitinophagaceae bacterium]